MALINSLGVTQGAMSCIVGTRSTSNQNIIGTAWTVFVFNNEAKKVGSAISLNTSTGVFTINESGLYLISWHLTMRQYSGNNRVEHYGRAYVNGVTIPESYCQGYSRGNSTTPASTTGRGTLLGGTFVKELVATNTVDIRAANQSSSYPHEGIAGGCSASIVKLL